MVAVSPGSPECAAIPPQPAGGEPGCGYTTPGCLNATYWDQLYAFSEAAGAEFIFGVAFGDDSACPGGSTGTAGKCGGQCAGYTWNATNVGVLLDYMEAHQQKVFGFELGNEVNNQGGPPCNVTADQQAAAMKLFAPMAKKQMPGAVLIGPDSGYRNAEDYLKAYLPLVEDVNLHAVTHHVYPGISRTGFNSPSGRNFTSSQENLRPHTFFSEIDCL